MNPNCLINRWRKRGRTKAFLGWISSADLKGIFGEFVEKVQVQRKDRKSEGGSEGAEDFNKTL